MTTLSAEPPASAAATCSGLRVALVHDWLTTMRQFCRISYKSRACQASISTATLSSVPNDKEFLSQEATAPAMVACVILNWNRGYETLRCLRAFGDQAAGSMTCTVVDNGSTDGSAALVRSAHPGVTVIETGVNLGFAAGNNVGIRHAIASGSEFVWLLNNDTEPQPGALQAMLATAESDPRIAAVGSVLRYTDPPHAVQSWGGGKVKLWAGYSHTARTARADEWFDYICASSMLVRREALLDVGLLDERYFLYWEDVDLGFRLRQKGWKLAVAEGSVVLHRENASTVGESSLRDRYSTASCLRFIQKWSPHPQVASAVYLVSRVAKRMATGQFSRVGGVLRGFRDARALPPPQVSKA